MAGERLPPSCVSGVRLAETTGRGDTARDMHAFLSGAIFVVRVPIERSAPFGLDART